MFFLLSNLAYAEQPPLLFTPADTRPECIPKNIAPEKSVNNELELPFGTADSLSQPIENEMILQGDVEVEYPQLILNADQIKLNKTQQTAEAFGNVRLYQKDLVMTGTEGKVNQKTQTAELENSVFQFTLNKSHGRSQHVFIDKTDRQAKLTQATYTSCRLTDLKWQARDLSTQTVATYDWELDFTLLRIDDASRRIYGDHAVLYFHQVPVFYSPIINFPMDPRASGFLFPQIGSYKTITRDVAETYVNLPYYINIAPEVDDTVSIMSMQDRGLVFGNEFRYLQPKHSATLNTHWLRDRIANAEGLGYLDNNGEIQYTDPVNERWDAHLIARQNWAPGLTSSINWREISDENFYADVPVDTALDTKTYVERNAHLNYIYNDFSARLSMVDYLRLRKNTPYNYEKRPELSINYTPYLDQEIFYGLGTNILAESTEFEVSYSADHNRPEGQRNYLSPAINYSIRKLYGGIKAEAVANKVHYQLQDNGYNNTGQDDHDITVPQFALKANLVFERPLQFNKLQLTQTLEPEVQYLFVPYQDQSNIPIFDTTEQSLDFSNLFSYNRFSGYDRIGDTNQISAALTSRFLTSEGAPIAELGLGQIFYLADRQVSLNGIPNSQAYQYTSGVSDYFAKAGFNTQYLSVASTAQFSYLDYQLTNANSRLKLDLTPDFNWLLTHRLEDANQPIKQEDLATGFFWKIDTTWSLGSYWNYDFTQNRKSEVSSALKYDDCCWAFELSVKEEQLQNGLYNYSVQYLIELKGLSSVGTPFNQYLTDKLNF